MLKGQTERHDEVIRSILDGSYGVKSIDEFNAILAATPENPLLFRTYGDALVNNDMYDAAADAYKQSSSLFLESNNILQAIFSKILQWSVIKVRDRECRAIYTALREIRTEEVPSYEFFARMNYSELAAVLGELECVRMPAGELIKGQGEPETDLYFIAEGVLSETIDHYSQDNESQRFTVNLTETMFFGDIYPIENEKFSRSVIESYTNVDLLKISKGDIVNIRRRYPNIDFLTMRLCRTRNGSGNGRYLHLVRATTRYQLQTKVTLKIFPQQEGENPLVINGITDDLSLGGACIRLGEKYWTGSITNLVGRTVKMLISVPKVSAGIDVLGKIVWRREVAYDERKNILVGIQFQQMSPDEFEFLKKHCYVGDGEQDMIYSLWESYVKK